MKVEVGESILYSWLRHMKGCQVVQLNWKTSSEWDLNPRTDEMQCIMDKAQEFFGTPFKKTSSVTQLLRQAEIDGIGINIGKKEIHAADVAFHESGVNYGSRKETVQNIVKKYLRTALVIEAYFPKNWKKQNIYFISPKITPAVYKDLLACVDDVKSFISGYGLNSDIHLIANEKFNTDILNKLIAVSDGHSDTSELFLRSIQLLKMFE